MKSKEKVGKPILAIGVALTMVGSIGSSTTLIVIGGGLSILGTILMI